MGYQCRLLESRHNQKHEVGASFLNFQVVAQREAESRAELAATPEVVTSVPYFDHDLVDLAGLLELGDTIWR